jgi:4-methyl-5(b-hydroxyethyl)-thiazole monophosphate biosynthesis
MTQRVLVPLATGFEEIEAVTIVDVLRRAGVEVVLAGITPGVLVGARGIAVRPDTTFDAVDVADFDVIVLPGGLAGTEGMMADERVLAAVRSMQADGRLVAAICAAPMVLERAGVVAGKRVTAHPSVHDKLGSAVVCAEARVLTDGRLVTSQGPGTAMEFALALVRELVGEAEARRIAGAMVV